jgi:hypothetical protein
MNGIDASMFGGQEGGENSVQAMQQRQQEVKINYKQIKHH